MKFLFIFDPDAVWLLVPALSLLWAAGGSGPKLVRRAGVPGLAGLAAFSVGVSWWLSLLTVGAMVAAITVPYGEKMKNKLGLFYWPYLYLVAALYAAAMLPLCFARHHWLGYGVGIAATGLCFGFLTFTSQRFDFPRWKFVEMILGACLGLTAALLLL